MRGSRGGRVRTICFALCVSSIAEIGAAIGAEMNLRLVQSVLQAIRTADIQSGHDQPPRQTVIVEPRRDQVRPAGGEACHKRPAPASIRPAAQSLHWCYAPRPVFPPGPPVPTVQTVVVQTLPDEFCSPLQPPWKSLPWEQPAADAPHIKIVLYQPDMRHKGTLVDCFI
jgi:hypothetical protein